MTDKRFKISGIILFLAAFFVIAILLYNSSGKNTKPFNEGSFPKNLQGLTLQQVITGPQALGMISKLHGTDITIKQGYIASYAGPQGQIMIWVSESDNVPDAIELFDVMDKKIAAVNEPGQDSNSGQPPFTNRRELKENGINVIAVEGMGMENYYYQIDDKVYWIAAGGVTPIDALREVMNKI